METWLDRIRNLKQMKRITNENLSAKTGIPIGTLNKLLCGASSDPKLSTLVTLSRFFGVSLDFIAFGNSKKAEPEDLDLSHDENALVQKFRTLDNHAKELTYLVMNKEFERCALSDFDSRNAPPPVLKELPAKKITSLHIEKTRRVPIRLPLYDLPVSAGRGSFLDSSTCDFVTVTANDVSEGADFVLRVSGDSMEPRYHDGDFILVREQPSVNVGELGIFVAQTSDGFEGYFKRLGHECLCSLNPKYADIKLSDFNSVTCRGKVIGGCLTE